MILCAAKNEEHIALLELQKERHHVASYWTGGAAEEGTGAESSTRAVRLARARLEAAKD